MGSLSLVRVALSLTDSDLLADLRSDQAFLLRSCRVVVASSELSILNRLLGSWFELGKLLVEALFHLIT